MSLFARLLRWALAAGGSAGLVLTALHQGFAVPLILDAERLEAPGETAVSTFSRLLGTALTDVLAGLGFALLLGAIWLWRGQALNVWRGLLWGVAAYCAVSLAPALSLPPELPGSASADLGARQMWWLATVVCTSLGFAVFAFLPGLWRKLPGLVLVVVPQWVGAPKAVGAEDLVPAAMALNFVTVALLTSGVFWVLMGAVGGHLFDRLVRPKQ